MIFTPQNYDLKTCEICGQQYNKALIDLIYNVCSEACFTKYMIMIQDQFLKKG
jgi:hypothetical protein